MSFNARPLPLEIMLQRSAIASFLMFVLYLSYTCHWFCPRKSICTRQHFYPAHPFPVISFTECVARYALVWLSLCVPSSTRSVAPLAPFEIPKPFEGCGMSSNLAEVTRAGLLVTSCPTVEHDYLCRGYRTFDFTVNEGKGSVNRSRDETKSGVAELKWSTQTKQIIVKNSRVSPPPLWSRLIRPY